MLLHSVYTGCVDKLWALVSHIQTRKNVNINMCLEILNLWVIPERAHLQQVLKMSTIRSNAHLNMSHHGLPHPFKDAEIVVDSLTGIHKAMVKCLFVVNRGCIHKGFSVFPQVKIQRIQIWQVRKPCSGSSSAYPLVMIGVIENTSHRTSRMPMYNFRALTASGTCSSSFGGSHKRKSR